LVASRIIAAIATISLRGMTVNSTEIIAPSLPIAGTERRSPSPYRLSPVRVLRERTVVEYRCVLDPALAETAAPNV